MTLVPLSVCLGVEDAFEQNGIFRGEPSFFDLQDLDQSALLGEFVLPGRQLLGDDLAIAGATQLVYHRSVVGVDGVAADARFARERGTVRR